MRRKERSERITAQRSGQIRAAALRVFSRRGFHAASTQEIAGEAGVSEGLLFHYFKTKKDLLLELVAPVALDALGRLLEETRGEPDEVVLCRFLERQAALIRSHIDVFKLLFYEAQFHDELRERFLHDFFHKGARPLEDYIRGRVDTGAFRADVEPPVAVRTLVGMFGSFIVLKEILRDPAYAAANDGLVIRQMVSVFLDGMQAARPPVPG